MKINTTRSSALIVLLLFDSFVSDNVAFISDEGVSIGAGRLVSHFIVSYVI